jgi:TPR repeat protein
MLNAPEACEWRAAAHYCRWKDGAWRLVATPDGFDERTPARAQAGDVRAMRALALFDIFTLRNTEQALYWLHKAVDLGDPEAMWTIGHLYESNTGGLASDPAEVARWYRKAGEVWRKAAEAGDTRAMLWLSLMYHEGRGVAQDQAESKRWLYRAAERGDANALLSLADSEPNKAERLRWRQKATVALRRIAEAGDTRAMVALAEQYISGEGIPEDRSEAIKWLRKAAAAGDRSAQIALLRISAH